jgi:uncharacterized membrane protein YphA (DoxX/SURF4 family)
MSDLAARKTDATPRAGVARTVALWVLQVALAFQFAGGGLLKLTGAPEMVDLFADVGAGQWLRFVVGAVEVAGAVGLLIPRLSGLAALGLAGVLVGATLTNLFVIDQSPWLAIVLLLACALVAWGRWSRTTALLAGRRR